MTELLRAEGISFAIDDFIIVSNVSLSLAHGEFVSIVGPSGSGKTTLFRILAGLRQGYTGSVYREGRLVNGPSRECILVDQNLNLFPWMRCLEHIKFALPRPLVSDWRATAERLLAEVGLADFSHRFPSELSGGMKQRLALARAIAAQPKLLFLDEPFSALDVASRQDISDLILSLLYRNLVSAIVLVSHDIRDAIYTADRILVVSSRPASISREIIVPFDKPRRHEIKLSDTFTKLQAKIESEMQADGVKT